MLWRGLERNDGLAAEGCADFPEELVLKSRARIWTELDGAALVDVRERAVVLRKAGSCFFSGPMPGGSVRRIRGAIAGPGEFR